MVSRVLRYSAFMAIAALIVLGFVNMGTTLEMASYLRGNVFVVEITTAHEQDYSDNSNDTARSFMTVKRTIELAAKASTTAISNNNNSGANNNEKQQQPRVCFIGQSAGLYTKAENVTDSIKQTFQKRLDVLRNVSLYSWNLAMEQEDSPSTTIKPLVRCPVTGWESLFSSYEEFRAYMGTFDNINVDFTPDIAAIKRRLMRNPEQCDWVVITHLDGDDALRPGYWNYIQGLIQQEKRFDAAGAGMVGTHHIPAVESTPDKCRAVIESNRKMVKSQGISTVYRWDIFEKMNYPFLLGSHGEELGKLRLGYSGKVLGNKEHLALIGGNKQNDREDMIEATGVQYVDSVLDGWGAPALWIRTSLSSHFPWIEWKKVEDGCGLEKWIEEIHKQTDSKFDHRFLMHLYNHRNIGHLSLLEACESNNYFLRFQYIRMKLKDKKEAKTCEEFVELYASYVDDDDDDEKVTQSTSEATTPSVMDSAALAEKETHHAVAMEYAGTVTKNLKISKVVDMAKKEAANEKPTVCFIGQSAGLYTKAENVTDSIKQTFQKRLDVLRNVSLYSWNLALERDSPSSIKPLVRCPVTGWESLFSSYEAFVKYMGTYDNINVDFAPNMAAIKNRLVRNADQCDWVVITRLDGDDALRPGYWNYIQDLITEQKRFDAAGAGLVGTKLIPAVESTPDKCRANIEVNKKIVKSQGISTVYRWDIFEKMNYPFVLGTHAAELGNLRLSYSAKILGNKEDLALIAGNKQNEREDMIDATGVQYVDSVLDGWGAPALWIRTSLSSHFPWIEWKKVEDGCGLEKWIEEINRETDSKFDRNFLSHLYSNRNIGHLSLLEACQSNHYFLRFQYVRMRLKDKKEAKTCEEFVELYASYVDEEPTQVNETETIHLPVTDSTATAEKGTQTAVAVSNAATVTTNLKISNVVDMAKKEAEAVVAARRASNEKPTVCFIGQSAGLYTRAENVTDSIKQTFQKRLDILRNVSLYSWNLALERESSSTMKPLISCPVTGWETLFDSYEEFVKYMGTFDNINVEFTPNIAATKRRLMRNPEQCDWVVITRLDGDDALRPGYWNYIQGLIQEQKRFDAAGAGMVGTHHIPAVESTPDKCRAVIESNRKMVKSQGISTVYRWDIFEKMNYPFILGSHGEELGKLRLGYSGKVLGNKEDLALIGGNKQNEREDMIEATGVQYVDSVLDGWGAPALWIRTSLSSHFPWIEWKKVDDGCTLYKWLEVINKETDSKFDHRFLLHLYNHRNIGHLSLLEACESNHYFLRFQYIRMRLKDKTEAKTCEEFVELYASYVEE